MVAPEAEVGHLVPFPDCVIALLLRRGGSHRRSPGMGRRGAVGEAESGEARGRE